MSNPHKQLTNRDVAFGIGRKATKEELQEYLDKPVGKFVDATTALTGYAATTTTLITSAAIY